VNKNTHPSVFRNQFHSAFLMPALLMFFLFSLAACATPSASFTDNVTQNDFISEETVTETAKNMPEKPAEAHQFNDKISSDTGVTDFVASSLGTPNASEISAPPVATESVRIVESCKNEPYGKYEKLARASMAKGLKATMEGKYGVGFRNVAEHKKWSSTHRQLFNRVNQACSVLSQCAKQHPKDKTTQCTEQASRFKQWQDMAKRFATSTKLSETTQPPKICSFTPDLGDPARCFHGLADNIDGQCDAANCKETSDCWRGIGFLDYAINQASSACGFVQKPLAECQGYVTATQRRVNKFKRCNTMQKKMAAVIFPAL